jgi:hypothetical protein
VFFDNHDSSSWKKGFETDECEECIGNCKVPCCCGSCDSHCADQGIDVDEP